MTVPEAEPSLAAERVADAAAAGPENAGRWNDPRLPWCGKPRAGDILWLGIVLSGVYYWALLPLRLPLIGTHPVVSATRS
jgi:hypothetical protein